MKLRKLHSPLAILLITAVLLSVMLLPGCRSSGLHGAMGTPSTTGDPVPHTTSGGTLSTEPTIIPVGSTTASAKPVVEYITPSEYPEINTYGTLETPVLPIPAGNASEETWTAFFYGLLSAYGSWYNMALTSFYEEPGDLNLYYLFYNGTRYGQPELTQQEKDFGESLNKNPNIEQRRLPVSEMNTVLNTYFGTAFSKYDMTKYEELYYLDKTDCYYMWSTGAHCTDVLGIVGYQVLENGDYAVRYASDLVEYPCGLAEVVLRRTDDYFQIVANRIVE